MNLNELQDGQVVRARRGRYVNDLPEPKWEPWREETLYVQRFKGDIVTLALKDGAWAEYDPRRDFAKADPNGQYPAHFECEGYYLEIEGLNG